LQLSKTPDLSAGLWRISKGILTEVPTTVHEVKRDLQPEVQTVQEATYSLLRHLGLATILEIQDPLNNRL